VFRKVVHEGYMDCPTSPKVRCKGMMCLRCGVYRGIDLDEYR